MRVVRCQSGFTLVELLVVISIMAILIGLTVPALKKLGKGNITVSAARQLLDDVGRARALAISHRTTVYMVFVPTNYWTPPLSPSNWTNTLNAVEYAAAVNLGDKQLSGYTFVSSGALGDQPGNHQWRYLSPWQNLPDSSYIAAWKFQPRTGTPVMLVNGKFPVYGFSTTNQIPFPTVSNTYAISGPTPFQPPVLPYIAFNYLGQLTINGTDPSLVDEYIPLAQGSVAYSSSPTNKVPLLNIVQPSAIVEAPPFNSTNSMFNLVHIDALTGRSRLEFQKVQ